MKNFIFLTLFVVFFNSVQGMGQRLDAIPCFDNLSNQEFKTIMTADKEMFLLDVRTPEEFSAGNIENALNINILEADFKEKAAKLDKNKTYLVYCRSGARSARAAQILCDLGFKKVHNLATGFNGWK